MFEDANDYARLTEPLDEVIVVSRLCAVFNVSLSLYGRFYTTTRGFWLGCSRLYECHKGAQEVGIDVNW